MSWYVFSCLWIRWYLAIYNSVISCNSTRLIRFMLFYIFFFTSTNIFIYFAKGFLKHFFLYLTCGCTMFLKCSADFQVPIHYSRLIFNPSRIGGICIIGLSNLLITNRREWSVQLSLFYTFTSWFNFHSLFLISLLN